MSHSLHNPIISWNQSSTQGQYGLTSIQAKRDPSGASTVTPANSGGMFFSLPSQLMNNRPEQSRPIIDENIESSMHISRGKEEVRLLGKQIHQPKDQGTCFTSTQREEFFSLGTGMSSTSASTGYRPSDIEYGSSSLEWSSNFTRPPADDPTKLYSSSALSNYASGGDSRFSIGSERECDMRPILGLGKPVAPTESSKPKFTSESAASILLQFGLETEDLDHLVQYPEDQFTPANLPFILREIRIKKTKRALTVFQSKPCSEPQPTRSVGGMNSHSLCGSGETGMHQEEMSLTVLKPSKVIDYGLPGKYTVGVGDEIGRTSSNSANSGMSGSMMLMETSLSSSYSSVLSSMAPPSDDQTEPNQTSVTILSSVSLPKEDTDIRVLKFETPKSVPLKEPEADPQSTSQIQPPSTLCHGVQPIQPGLGSNDPRNNKDTSKTQEQGSTVVEQMNKQQTPQKPMLPRSITQPPTKMADSKNLPTASMIHDFAAATPRIFPHTCCLCNKACIHMKDWITHQKTSLHLESCKLLRKRYPEWDGDTALSPRSLSRSHSQWHDLPTSSCYQSCSRRSRERRSPPKRSGQRQSPPRRINERRSPLKRNGERQSPQGRSDERHSQQRSDKRQSPPRRSDKRLTSLRTSDERQLPPRRSDKGLSLRSDERQSPTRKSGKRRLPPRKSDGRQSPPRNSEERQSPPRKTGKRRLPPRKSDERQSPPRKSEKRRSPPKKSVKKQLPPRNSNERQSPPRKSEERRSPPKKSGKRRLPPRRRSPQQEESSSLESLARKLLEMSAVQSLSNPSDLEALVKILAPALVAELGKMKSSSSSFVGGKPSSSSTASSSSLSSTAKKELTKNLSKAKPSLQKSKGSSFIKTKSVRTLPPTMVKLGTIHSSVSYKDVLAAVEHFGKTKTVVQCKRKATVCFEKEEDAKKLKSVMSLDVKGTPISVVREKESESKEQRKPPQKKPATSSVSTPQTTTTTKVHLPTPAVSLLKGPKTLSSLPSVVRKAEAGQLTNQKIAVKGRITVTNTKALHSTVKIISTKQRTKMIKTGKLPAKGAVRKAVVKQKTAPENQPAGKNSKPKESRRIQEAVPKDTAKVVEKGNVPVFESKQQSEHDKANDAEDDVKKAVVKQKTSSRSKSTAPENKSDREISKPKKSETKIQEAAPKNTAKVVGTANVTVSESKHQAELDKADARGAKRMEIGGMGVESCAGHQGEKPTTIEAVPEDSTDTSVKALPHIQQRNLTEPESTARGPENNHMQQQAAGRPSEAVVEAKVSGGGVETTTVQKDPVTAAKTQTDAASANDASKDNAVTLTVGEMIEQHLTVSSLLECLEPTDCISPKLMSHKQHRQELLITNLPEYYDGCYTEDDLAKLLVPFGFRYSYENIYIVPQTRMAFVVMPNVKEMLDRQDINFKGFKLHFYAVGRNIAMTPAWFYKGLMRLMCSHVYNHIDKTVFIHNISWREAGELRETLRKIDRVKNFLPLLNKVFIEFESSQDADRLGVWYSFLKQAPGHQVHRLRGPHFCFISCPPKLPENALPDSKDAVAGATVPPMEFGIPQGSVGPCWVTLRTRPFLFPTVSPWYIIPDYLTVRGQDDIEKACGRGSMFHTIMLTGLPAENYSHEDVAKLVWPYFPKQSLHTLYYNVVVLPLQRRAFVFFTDWTTCCNFVRDHIKHPVSLKGRKLIAHFVMQHMSAESSEEMMYTSLMKWSNAGVPEPKSLAERLLCVEISETSVDIIRAVIEVVASIATFVSFLPLANRICIEMADSSGVTNVEKYRAKSLFRNSSSSSKVQCFESLKSLKQRLQDSDEVTMNC